MDADFLPVVPPRPSAVQQAIVSVATLHKPRLTKKINKGRAPQVHNANRKNKIKTTGNPEISLRNFKEGGLEVKKKKLYISAFTETCLKRLRCSRRT